MVKFGTFNFNRKVVNNRILFDYNYAINQIPLKKEYWDARRYRLLTFFTEAPTLSVFWYGMWWSLGNIY